MISAETGLQLDPAHLLEVGELGDLHAVEPHLPPQAPGAERGRLPVVLDEADVVLPRVDAEAPQRLEVQLQDVRGGRLEDHLVLVVVLQAVRVLPVAAVGRPAGRLHVRRLPRLRAQGPQESGRVKRARPHFHIVGLQHNATLLGPVTAEFEYEF